VQNKFYIPTDLEMYNRGTLICSYLCLLSIWQRFFVVVINEHCNLRHR